MSVGPAYCERRPGQVGPQYIRKQGSQQPCAMVPAPGSCLPVPTLTPLSDRPWLDSVNWDEPVPPPQWFWPVFYHSNRKLLGRLCALRHVPITPCCFLYSRKGRSTVETKPWVLDPTSSQIFYKGMLISWPYRTVLGLSWERRLSPPNLLKAYILVMGMMVMDLEYNGSGLAGSPMAPAWTKALKGQSEDKESPDKSQLWISKTGRKGSKFKVKYNAKNAFSR